MEYTTGDDRHGGAGTQRTDPSPTTGRTGRRVRPPLSDMVRRVGSDAVALLRQELKLAQLEFKENATRMGKDMMQAVVWICVAAVGGLALTASLIIGLGLLMNGSYWASALIVGGLFALVGGLMARRAANRMDGEDLMPDKTVGSLKQDQRWARREADDLKRSIKES